MERSLRLFLEQDYRDPVTLVVYNNSLVKQKMGIHDIKLNQFIEVWNADKKYTNLGEIYNDILQYVYDDGKSIITHWDDDDLFLRDHISEGVKGLERGGKTAYKPAKSYFRHGGGTELMSNVLEPSMFVKASHILKYGYAESTTDQHLQWVNKLTSSNEIFVDEAGKPTLIYNWGDTDIPTWKTSGGGANQQSFDNYRAFSQDHGDKILTPWKKEEVEKYYKLVNG